jgi:uncharacterized repeat protein (TIGR03803 family)
MAKIEQQCGKSSFGLLWLACALGAAGIAPAQAQTASEIVLHNFATTLPHGQGPEGGVIRDSAGNYYGTTPLGGTANHGTVYKVGTAGHQKVLYNFTGAADGGNPASGVIRDSAGNLYGTNLIGGTAGGCFELGCGVVYKLDTTGHYTVLYAFTGGADGGAPYAGLIRDSAGNLYGTTSLGGTSGAGVVYKLDAAGRYVVLYSFTGGADGGVPHAGVIRDAAGNFYGTTSAGGQQAIEGGSGVVYMLDTAGHETVLYAFCSLYPCTDGADPYAGVIRDSAGNLYGTTRSGGTAGCGVVYKLDTTGHYAVLYNFTGGPDGAMPQGGVIRDATGNLFGTTMAGGSYSGSCYLQGCGVVFKLDTLGHQTVLHSFTGGADGSTPYASLTGDTLLNLYGTTALGGAVGAGVVFKLDASGQQTVLYSFPGGNDGNDPEAGVTGCGSTANLYGTTYRGGVWNAGVVYRLDATRHETVLYNFAGGADGGNPAASVICDAAGNLYGTTTAGGTANVGVIFKLDAAGQQTVLYNFTGGADGGQPSGNLVRDADGNLYGTTSAGGNMICVNEEGGCGVVYKLDTSGNYTVLYSFLGWIADDGEAPNGVIRDSAGNLYGTTAAGGTWNGYSGFGLVYKLNAAGGETVLYRFTGGADGLQPNGGLALDSTGNLYGTTQVGGPFYGGGVFKVDAAGNCTVLYQFTGGADGGTPYAGVIRDAAGNLYGTTAYGGRGGGVVYKLDTAGHETLMYSFMGTSDGHWPWAGVIRDPAGNLYGTTAGGGKDSGGVVFRIKMQ